MKSAVVWMLLSVGALLLIYVAGVVVRGLYGIELRYVVKAGRL